MPFPKEALRRMIDAALRPVIQRVLMLVARGVLESTKDSNGIQLAKISLLDGETREDLERVQRFGFGSRPPANSEVVAIFIGGNRELGFVIADDDRATRIKGLAEGESVQYNAAGQKIHIKANGDIEALGKKFKFQGDSAELIDLFDQTLDALLAEPFIVNKATFTQIKTDLLTLKV